MMDTYVECLVKRKKNGLYSFLKGLCIFIAVITFFLGAAYWFIWILTVAAAVGIYFCGLKASVEYEYLYVDRQITIDSIMAQSKRKKVETIDTGRIEIFAPINSWHLDEYKHRQVKEIDYSIGYEEKPDRRYVMIYNGEKKFIMSPSPELVAAVKSVAPRKVFTD